MNIVSLITGMRQALVEDGEYELFPFPATLAQPWCHPDLLLSILGKKSRRCFTFQNLLQDKKNENAFTICPQLTWLLQSSEQKLILQAVDNFLFKLQKKLLPEREDSAFSILAEKSFLNKAGTRGCAWLISFDGIICGRLNFYSEILFEYLEKTAAILTINPAKLSGLLVPENYSKTPYWSEITRLDSVLALQAFNYKYQNNPAAEVCRDISRFNDSFFDETTDYKDLCESIISSLNGLCLNAENKLEE